jgi:DNA mismatch endonuclease, patch repair protein
MTLRPPQTDEEFVDPARSALMARIGPKHTKPELEVRRILRTLGERYSLHRATLPGSPDICISGKKKIVFVHGCFWHRHRGCRKTTTPKTRRLFWLTKFKQNVARDRRNVTALRRAGWGVLVVWECQCHNPERLERRLESFLAT